MKVYIVISGTFDDMRIRGVYSTEEKAKKRLSKITHPCTRIVVCDTEEYDKWVEKDAVYEISLTRTGALGGHLTEYPWFALDTMSLCDIYYYVVVKAENVEEAKKKALERHLEFIDGNYYIKGKSVDYFSKKVK